MPVRAKHSKLMKGRPITREETERMLESVPSIVGAKAAPSWRELIEGLWNSGLRISEALTLSWDTYAGFSVDMDGRYPMFLIRADSEKGNQDRLLAMAPEFARQLKEIPEDQRRGRVFRLVGMKRDSVTDPDWASKVICKIGRAAGVVVNKTPKVKFASAHDLRRSFGERWSQRVLPQVLMELMRHESIETTQKYYVGRNANRTAAALWAADCDHSCDIDQKAGESSQKKKPQPLSR